MALIKKLKESDSIVIEGDKKTGKLTLAFYFAKLIDKKTTFVSPLASPKVTKKIDSFVNSFEIFKDLNSFLKKFSLREDWMSLKEEYGYKYFLKDLEYFISHQENEVIIFHKIDTFFEYADRDFLETFLSELLGYGITYKKKFIFTLNIDDPNYDMLGRFLVDNTELYLKLSIQDSIRYIDVLYSLTPISQQHYIFENEDTQLILEAKSMYSGQHEDISIVLITSNPYLQQIHKYMLDKESIELMIADNISDALEAILKNPDYMIFAQESEEVKLSICSLAKEHKLKTQILYLTNRDFIRVDDRMKSKELGCVDMIKLDTNIMNYVLELEKYFNLVFYKKPENEHKREYRDKEEFKTYIKEVIEKRGIFTLIKIDEKLDENDYSFIREYDKVLVTDEYSVIFMLNILKSNVEDILKIKFKKEIHTEKIQDSLDIFFGEEICID